tara:strand:- start:618 stop:866 length:249 start_codon:yes stop_codon:yes gene_type:complete
MALSGHSIAMLPTFIMWDALARGELLPILENYALPAMHAYAIYPSTQYLSQKVRHFIDFLIEQFGDHPYWDNHRIDRVAPTS